MEPATTMAVAAGVVGSVRCVKEAGRVVPACLRQSDEKRQTDHGEKAQNFSRRRHAHQDTGPLHAEVVDGTRDENRGCGNPVRVSRITQEWPACSARLSAAVR